MRARSWLFVALAAPLAAACVLVPPARLFSGIYAWHWRQPSAVEGSLELLALLGLWLAALWLLRSRAAALAAVAALGALYLQLHAALLQTLAALLLFELLVQLGGVVFVWRAARAQPTLQAQLEAWLAGLALWTACALAAAGLRAGGLVHLRVLLLALGAVCIAARRREPFVVTGARRFLRASRLDASLALGLLLLLALQLAKAAVVADYDSRWYGLRPEKVLFGPRSFFTDLRLVHFVYHYPAKLLELLAAPVSGLGEPSFILAAGVAVLGVGMVALYRLGRELGASASHALLLALVASSIPGVSNMASTAKGDLLCAVLGLVAAISLWRAARRREAAAALPGLVALVLMLLARMTGFLYAPLLALGAALAWAILRAPAPAGPKAPRRPWAALLAVALFDALGLALRSIRFTGQPTPPILGGLWSALGLHAHYPADQLAREYKLGFVPAGGLGHFWARFFFDPTGLDHVIIAWPGNCALLLGVLFTLSWVVRRPGREELARAAFALPACCGALLYATFGDFPHVAPGGDGNYYIVAAALGAVAFGAALLRQLDTARAVPATLLAVAALGQAPIAFISHWSWNAGTAPFSLRLNRFLPGAQQQWRAEAERQQVVPLLDYAAAHPEQTTCAGTTWRPAVDDSQTILWGMDCRYEDFDQLFTAYPALFTSEETVLRLLRWKQVDLLVIPRVHEHPREPPPLRSLFERLRADPLVSFHESGPFVFLDLSRLTGVNR